MDLDSDLRGDALVKGGRGLLVASYDGSGTLRWAKVGVAAGDLRGTAIAVTLQGAVQVAGHAEGDADLNGDGRTDLQAPESPGAAFLAHFDASGTLLGVAALPGEGPPHVRSLAHSADGRRRFWTADTIPHRKPSSSPAAARNSSFTASAAALEDSPSGSRWRR